MRPEPTEKLRYSLYWFSQFVAFVARNTIVDRCSFIASGLTVTTMLSLVPLMTVIFSVLAAFPAYENVGDDIQQYVFKHFVPNSGEQIQNYLSGFINQASRLKTLGIAILVATALLLMRTIDKAFNVIWHTQDNRRPLSVFLVYWAVLSLGPIFLGLSIGLTSYFVTLPMVSSAFAHLGRIIETGLPFLLTTMALSLMYWVIPNRSIKILHALLSGLFAAALFELAKAGFSFYVTNVPSYQIIFGALAVIPIFLIWMYLSWIIVLLGAEICHALGIFTLKQVDDSNRFVVAYNVIHEAWRSFQEGKGVEKSHLVELGLCNDETLAEVLECLYQRKWLISLDADHVFLGRDIDKMTLYDLIRSLPWAVPRLEELPANSVLTGAFKENLVKLHKELATIANNRLVHMYRQE